MSVAGKIVIGMTGLGNRAYHGEVEQGQSGNCRSATSMQPHVCQQSSLVLQRASHVHTWGCYVNPSDFNVSPSDKIAIAMDVVFTLTGEAKLRCTVGSICPKLNGMVPAQSSSFLKRCLAHWILKPHK